MSEFGRLDVDESGEGARLDRWLSEAPVGLSRSRWQKLIEERRVRVNGRCRPGRHRLHAGDHIDYEIPDVEEVDLSPDPTVPFDILHEDEHLAVVDKPAGVVVHPAPGNPTGTLVHGLLARLSNLSEVGGRARPGIVHRLDADTSGLLVVAKTDRAHRKLQDQLRDRSLGRHYDALVWGAPKEPSGLVDAPLDRDPRERRRRAVVADGREARTRWELVEVRAGIAHLRCQLETGRTHQIRVHLSHIGHPVFADPLYFGDQRRLGGIAPPLRPRVRRALKVLDRQALHASGLHFRHPASGELCHFRSPWPEDILSAWARLADPPPHGVETVGPGPGPTDR